MTFYKFNTKQFPLVILKIKGKPKDKNEFFNFFLDWEKIFDISKNKNKKHRLLFDIRNSGNANMSQILHTIKWLHKQKKNIKQWLEKTAIISNTQFMIKIMLQLYTPSQPLKTFKESQQKEMIKWILNSNRNDTLDNSTFDFL